MKNILNIAEKPSIAREISKILGKPPQIIRTFSPFNTVYQFNLKALQDSLMRFTSVRGHIMEMKFQKDMSDWTSYDPRILFTQKVKKEIGVGNQKIDAQEIILWLDCDLEGEAIAGEVSDLCLKFNPHINIKRARFSSLSPKEIWYAVSHLDSLRNADIKAVNYRQQLDFRVGCAMTNIQTLLLKRQKKQLGKPINFGTCLIPIVNLIVERFIARKTFKSESYWRINLLYGKHWFTWAQDHNFTQKQNAYARAEQIKFAQIIKIQKQNIFKKRPLPLDTSTLLKYCTRQFKIESLKVMEIAQKLYQQGYISYPRTQTNRYSKGLNLVEIVKLFQEEEKYKKMVEYVLANEHVQARFGKDNDGAHAPIYPLKVKTQFKGGIYEQFIYEYIVTNFLASVSKDTQIQEHRIIIKANNGYQFMMKGSKMIDKGYLNIVQGPKVKQPKEQVMPSFVEGQNISITRTKIIESQTKAPPAIKEAELIELMQQNKIGTDATIAEHISNIQMKGFAEKIDYQFFPTKLGLALIQSYKFIQNPLADHKMRAKMQQNVKKITQNQALYQKIYQQTLNEFMSAYDHLIKHQIQFLDMFEKYINITLLKQEQKQIQELCCHNCHQTLKFYKRTLVCSNCSLRYFLPKEGEIRLLKKQECFKCKSVIMSVKKGETTYTICPRCFNYPEPHMIGPSVFKESPDDTQSESIKLPCFKCKISECIHSGNFKISSCPTCKQGSLKIIQAKNGKYFIGCSNWPSCKQTVFFSTYVNRVLPSDHICQSCSTQTEKVRKCKLNVGNDWKQAYVCVQPNCKIKRSYVKKQSIFNQRT